MSTNPFRRSLLKGPGGSNNLNSAAAHKVDEPVTEETNTEPLSIDTKAPGSVQKRVNFASPPAIPISPASYPPSSPESLRISPAFIPVQPVPSVATDYSEAIQSDPFHAEAETDEDDGAIQQALQNAKANVALVARDPQKEKEEAVKRTLSKFASVPRKQPSSQNNVQATSTAQRQTMDVDAFKRLLLTGDSGTEDGKRSGDGVSTSSLRTPSDDSSSDEGSLRSEDNTGSYRAKQITHEMVNTPSEVDRQGAKTDAFSSEGQTKTKPPPPKSRHGKSIVEKPVPSTAGSETRPSAVRSTSNSSIGGGSVNAEGPSTVKKAPPPPLSRRKSQNSTLSHTKSTRQSSTVDQEPVSVSSESVPRTVPPPPPTRRPNSVIIRHTVSDLPTTVEESDASDLSLPPNRHLEAQPKFPATTARPSTKITSTGNSNAPPVPPPRRGRDSSRSSIDSPRPALAALSGNVGSTRSSGEYVRPETVEMNASSTSSANDILADLATLQQEVDAARRSVSK